MDVANILIRAGKVFFLTLLTTACSVGPAPVEDYVLARTALEAARQIEAGRYSPGFFHKAENSYRKAKAYFDDRQYDKAKEEFQVTREYAEKSENSARLLQFKSGDVIPH